MNPIQYLTIALKSLWSNKVRSFLTMLGVIIGVFSVITFLAIGNGLQKEITGQFENFGSNLLIILPGKIEGPNSFQGSIGASTLSTEDVEDLRQQTTHLETVSPIMIVSAVVSYQGKTISGPLTIATDEQHFLIRNEKIAEGSFFTRQQLDNRARVVVLGGAVKEQIFGNEKSYGKMLRLFGQDFTVIGAVNKSSNALNFGDSTDNYIYLPISTAVEFTRTEQIFRILAKAKNQEVLGLAQQETKSILLGNHGTEDFSVLKQDEVLELFNDIFDNLKIAVSGIGAISLLVGGIGIMNIMFVSVTERTKEIGLRKAVGATNSNVLIQFLTEASILSIFGGGIGLLVAWGLTTILSKTVNLPTQVTMSSIVLAFGVSLAVGIIFGIVPAIRASRKNPIEALRYE